MPKAECGVRPPIRRSRLSCAFRWTASSRSMARSTRPSNSPRRAIAIGRCAPAIAICRRRSGKTLPRLFRQVGDCRETWTTCSVDPIEDTSKPFHLKYHLKQDQYFVVPSASVDFRPIPPLGVPAPRASAKSTDPIDIGPAGDMDYKVRLEFPANYSVHTPLAVQMSRDYGEYSSSYSLNATRFRARSCWRASAD